ncbi:MAG: hypothetical protein GX102_04695 [Porphyromonadaceae bacterium]|nr:hypothetical protein [Porphyromonadaceae bacterium]
MKTKATKAYKLMDEAVHVMSQGVIIYDSFTVVMTDDVEEIIDIAFKEGQSNPQIKELEWTHHGEAHYSNTIISNYIVYENIHKNTVRMFINEDLVRSYSTPEEAKQACQEDFEKRVKECLL